MFIEKGNNLLTTITTILQLTFKGIIVIIKIKYLHL